MKIEIKVEHITDRLCRLEERVKQLEKRDSYMPSNYGDWVEDNKTGGVDNIEIGDYKEGEK